MPNIVEGRHTAMIISDKEDALAKPKYPSNSDGLLKVPGHSVSLSYSESVDTTACDTIKAEDNKLHLVVDDNHMKDNNDKETSMLDTTANTTLSTIETEDIHNDDDDNDYNDDNDSDGEGTLIANNNEVPSIMGGSENTTSSGIARVKSDISENNGLPPPPPVLSGSKTNLSTIHRPIPIPKGKARSLQSSIDSPKENYELSSSSTKRRNTSVPPRYVSEEDEKKRNTPMLDGLHGETSPMARMRLESLSPESPTNDEDVSKQHKKKSDDEIFAAKHRKWKRNLRKAKRMQKAELEGYDDESLVSEDQPFYSCASGTKQIVDEFITHKPLQQIQSWCKGISCGSVEDVMSCNDFNDWDVNSVASEETSEEDSDEESRYARSNRDGSYANKSRSSNSRHQHRRGRSPGDSRKKRERSISEHYDTEDSPDEEESTLSRQPTKENNKMINNKRVGINDRSFIKNFIEEMSEEGVSLICHEAQSRHGAYQRPLACRVSLKEGRLGPEGNFKGPKLCWDAEEKDDKSAVIDTTTNEIDLFDIRSLEKATAMQMKDYPFAIPGNSLFLKLHNGKEILFEASSDSESRRFIHGLRWLVARLAFNLIIGNHDVSCELLSITDDMDLMTKESHDSKPMGSRYSKAMNDITNQLVDKTTFHID